MRVLKLSLAIAVAAGAAACATPTPETAPAPTTRDPREGLRAGMYNAAEAVSNLKIVAQARPQGAFEGSTNSDIAFTGNYAIQGNYNGFQVWDISNPASPVLVKGYVCPASQSDVSVYKNLLFVSGEGNSGRLDCGTQGVRDTVSAERLRGIRIFDISDIANPKYVANVQTCRGSHTHTVLEHPADKDNVYIYVSGSAGVRSPNELAGCVRDATAPNTSYFRIEIIKVPLANPQQAAIVGGGRIFENLTAPPSHGLAPEDIAANQRALAAAKAAGGFWAVWGTSTQERVVPGFFVRPMLDSIVKARGGTGNPTKADTVALQSQMSAIMQRLTAAGSNNPFANRGPTQCHDITVYPALGLAGGACEGYGFLLDITDPVNPRRIAAVADSNFSYWHSATFNNDGTKVLFSDEWGGGGSPKCRATDPKAWGANAIFTIENRSRMDFKSYYKLPAVQTSLENCVAHNGSLIPIPGRDVMVQSWYQGGVSVFDWTDPSKPFEMAYFDRGPSDSTRQGPGGTWSVYWYNGAMFSSEIARGLDIMELTPSQYVTQNEIDAAKTVRMDYFNAQGQPKFVWPPSFALARAYLDQLERNSCLSSARVSTIRTSLANAERAAGAERRESLLRLATDVQSNGGSCDTPKIGKLADTARQLAGIQP